MQIRLADGTKWPLERLERLWRKVDTVGDCWLWLGAPGPSGYGRFSYRLNRSMTIEKPAHRLIWQALVGPIAEGLEMDHLCRNRMCVNPDHLEVVTRRVNQRRGYSISGKKAKQTHCKQGHPLVEANIWRDKRGNRRCRICYREYMSLWYRQKRAKARAIREQNV